MDALFPSDNWLGIPSLDPTLQADCVPLPVLAWGSVARTSTHAGTWHAYVDDARFARLLREPDALVATGAAAAVEPNVSAYDDTPLALVLAGIYRKRWVARYWQSCGVRVFVDVNLPERVLDRDEWRAGVPDGWSAFATRGYDSRIGALESEYQAALTVSRSPLLLVVGGGRKVAEWCRGRAGVVHSGYASARRVYSGGERGEGIGEVRERSDGSGRADSGEDGRRD